MFPTETPERSLKISLKQASLKQPASKYTTTNPELKMRRRGGGEEKDEEEKDEEEEEEDDRHLLYPLRCAAADGLSASDEDHLLLFWRSRLLRPLRDLSQPGP